MDFEADITQYIVKQTNSDQQKQQQRPSNEQFTVEPLLIRDLLTIDASNSKFFTAFNGTLKFKQCIIRGRIIDCNNSNKKSQTYTIEDGTACIKVTVFDKEMKILKRLKQTATTHEDSGIREPLLRLLNFSEKLVNVFNLKLGTRVIVVGRPSFFHGKLCLVSDSFYVDEEIDRNCEIGFKDYLMERYRKRLG